MNNGKNDLVFVLLFPLVLAIVITLCLFALLESAYWWTRILLFGETEQEKMARLKAEWRGEI